MALRRVGRYLVKEEAWPCASTPTRKFIPELADAVDLQSLLDKLADFLLQSGFAGGRRTIVLRVGLRASEATARSTR